jgi:hypothetical protein
MVSESYYELYCKLAGARQEPSKALSVLGDFMMFWRDRRKAVPSSDERLAEADNCLDEIAHSSNLFAAAISNWLTGEEEVELARALVHKASVRHLQQEAAEAYNLSNNDEVQAILAGCRLCTLNAATAISLGWALSLAVSHPTSDKIGQAVKHLLQYHVDEFPWTTRRLLSSDDSPFKSVEKANEALAALEKQETWLSGLPRLREFAMTPEMQLTLSSLKRNENRDIHRHGRENSFFAQLFTAQYFKYANKTAVEFVVGDKVQETTLEMSPYSLAVELPLSERTDPESGVARRRGLWGGVPQ